MENSVNNCLRDIFKVNNYKLNRSEEKLYVLQEFRYNISSCKWR